MNVIDSLQHDLFTLPTLAKLAIGMAIIVGVPMLCRRVDLPAMVGLLLSGVIVGPHVIGIIGTNHPIADVFSELGKVMLMFIAVSRSTSIASASRCAGPSPSGS